MKKHILIRTYAQDRQWMHWCLRSCAKFVPDLPVTVVCPESDYRKVKETAGDTVVLGVMPMHKDGYIDQQWTKLIADHLCPDADYIIHVDSDCIWTAGWEGLFRDGKPLLLKTPYTDLVGSGGAEVWQDVTEEALGFRPEFEYMRRQPMVFPRKLYQMARDALNAAHEEGLWKWFPTIGHRRFSEFNVLGAVADKWLNEEFCWIDTTGGASLPETVMRQGWSWGGMTPEIKQEWEGILR